MKWLIGILAIVSVGATGIAGLQSWRLDRVVDERDRLQQSLAVAAAKELTDTRAISALSDQLETERRVAAEARALASAILEMEGSDAPVSDFVRDAIERVRDATGPNPAEFDPR